MIHVLANALTPIFVGLLLGYLAGRWRAMDNQHVQTLTTFVMSFAIPCSLFLAVATTPFERLREQARTGLVLATAYIVLYAISFWWSRTRERMKSSDSSVVALTLAFPNAAAVGAPLLGSVFGSAAEVVVALSLAIGSITISPITLIVLETARGGSQGLALKSVVIALVDSIKRPIVWAPALAVLFSCLHVSLPSYTRDSLSTIGAAADGAALVLTGLVVSAQSFTVGTATLVAVLLKNVFQPALALGAAVVIGLPTEETRYVTLASAIPCGFFGVVIGKGFDASPSLASSGLVASYLVGIATLTAWILILGRLG